MTTLYQNYTANAGDGYQTIVGAGWAAQTFTISTTHYITKVSLYMYKLGTPSAITASIRETTGGAPSGADKIVGTIAVGDIPASIGAADWVDCEFNSSYQLTATDMYAIIVRCTGSSGVNQIYWSEKAVTGAYAGGNKDFSTNSGSTWLGTTDTWDMHFKDSGVDLAVTTQACTYTIATKSTGHGNITDLGQSAVTQHGHCWNTSAYPTTSNDKTTNGAIANLGQFTSDITGLTPGTKYYVRAYATNTSGTAYGADVEIAGDVTTIGRRHRWVEGTKFHYFDEHGDERAIEGVPVAAGLPWWRFT